MADKHEQSPQHPYRTSVIVEAMKTGDRVELRSGGPTMTVERITPSGDVEVVWFQWIHKDQYDDDLYGDWTDIRRARFSPEVLILVGHDEDDE